jgi:Ni,Fe-hydrogenase I cytochrome b subunit
MSLINNVYVTSLLVYRLRKYSTSNHTIRRIIILVIESSAIYAFTQVLYLAFVASKFPGAYFVSDSILQIMVCVFVSMIFFLDDDGASVYGSNYNDSSWRGTEDARR